MHACNINRKRARTQVRALGRGVTYYYRFQLPPRKPGGPTPTRALAWALVYDEGFDVVKVQNNHE